MKRNRTAPIHFSPRDAHGTTSGTPTGARAAEDVGPYHAPRHVRTRTSRAAHARHVRTRTPCAHLVGRDVLGAPRPRDVHGTPSGTPTGARAAGDVGPYHAPRHVRTRTPRAAHARHVRTRTPCPHLVRRDVPGAPRPRDDIGDAHMYAGRRGRRPLPRTAPHPHTHTARRTRTPCAYLVGRDVLGAPLPTERHRGRPRARGPPGTSAPTTHRTMSAHARHVRTRTPCAHLVGRDVLGAPRPRNDIGDAHGHAGRRGRRPLPRSAPRPHTHGACLPCQRIETLMGFRNAAAKSRTRACHAFASFTAPAPLQVAPAQ